MVFPSIGIAIGVGFFVAELGTASYLLSALNFRGLSQELGLVILFYVAAGAFVDTLVQLATPRRFRGTTVLRWLAIPSILLLAAPESWPWMPMLAACAWALLTLRSATWPFALLFFGVAIDPALPDFHSTQTTHSAPADGPSIAVIVMDTVRRGHTSAYGYERSTTPNLRELAGRGSRFDRAYSTGCWSVPGHASLFTGLIPSNHGAHHERWSLETGIPTLAQALAEAGYETVGVSGNPFITKRTGLARGFTRYSETWATWVLPEMTVAGGILNRLNSTLDKGGAAAVRFVKEWSRTRDPDRPYFLFVNLMEAHSPYNVVPQRFRTAFLDDSLSSVDIRSASDRVWDAQMSGRRPADSFPEPIFVDLKDGALLAADHYLGEILAVLGDSAVVVVTSDHGDSMGEHGLVGHAVGLHDALLSIPLVMSGPGIPTGRVIDLPVSLADVMPTLLDLAGVESPQVDGVSLVPSLNGAPMSDRVLIAEQFRADSLLQFWGAHRDHDELEELKARKVAVLNRYEKRVLSETGLDIGFDLLKDSQEMRPFPGRETSLPARRPKSREVGTSAERELNEPEKNALRALGYVR